MRTHLEITETQHHRRERQNTFFLTLNPSELRPTNNYIKFTLSLSLSLSLVCDSHSPPWLSPIVSVSASSPSSSLSRAKKPENIW
ncbi:hypothetical protein VNO78_22309 [Psophocarpus tetragonolobus]|uniref:Uncharacterized protein n=1 Tax=Psophocarpus tetragonolobus TaxID=3891 RepID=A0AAN9XIT0_PSOTE